jgi:hypothetical protein
MNIVDDRHGLGPVGTEQWVESRFQNREKVLPLVGAGAAGLLFHVSEPAILCQNVFLATEARRLGGWMHCGIRSSRILEKLGSSS